MIDDATNTKLLGVLHTNGYEACLRELDTYEQYLIDRRILAVKLARTVEHLMLDTRSINALCVSEAYAVRKAAHRVLVAAKVAALGAIQSKTGDQHSAPELTVWYALKPDNAEVIFWANLAAMIVGDDVKGQHLEIVTQFLTRGGENAGQL